MIDPYLGEDGTPSDRRGLSFVEPSLLNEAIARLDREGFQVHVHAIGDRAAREALDAFEGARQANGARDARHHIAHLQVVHPEDVPRFARLGVVANAQALWACYDDQMRDLCVPYLGPERTSWQYPFGSLVRHGARLAMGSDWPVTTPEPMAQIEVGVTRIPTEARDRDPLNARERIDLETALHAFTAGSAFVNFLDDETGSIEEGKLADIVVLDRDVMAPDATPIGEAKAVLTLVDGEPVHADASIGW
jgi:predicted amidohydrolase YtcJ